MCPVIIQIHITFYFDFWCITDELYAIFVQKLHELSLAENVLPVDFLTNSHPWICEKNRLEDWPQMGQIRDFLRSVFSLKRTLSPKFVPFGPTLSANRTPWCLSELYSLGNTPWRAPRRGGPGVRWRTWPLPSLAAAPGPCLCHWRGRGSKLGWLIYLWNKQ